MTEEETKAIFMGHTITSICGKYHQVPGKPNDWVFDEIGFSNGTFVTLMDFVEIHQLHLDPRKEQPA